MTISMSMNVKGLLTCILLRVETVCQLVLAVLCSGDFAPMFWSSVDLTGNQTSLGGSAHAFRFWSSVDLTGNQTQRVGTRSTLSFGAVSI